MLKKLAAVLAVVVVLAGAYIWKMQVSPATDASAAATVDAPEGAAPDAAAGQKAPDVVAEAATPEANAPDAAAPAAEVTDFSLGDPAAKVHITEYASFTCPHCARFHDTVWEGLKKNYIDTGKVHFTYREVYFDRPGLWSAMMARCGGALRYFGIVDILFSTQKEWAGSDDPNVVVENIRKIGRSVGLEDAALDVCMKDAKMAEALVANFEKNFAADDIKGTPTFIVNGEKHSGEMSYEEFAKIVDDAAAK